MVQLIMNTQFPHKTYENFQHFGKQSGFWTKPKAQAQKLIYFVFPTKPYEPFDS